MKKAWHILNYHDISWEENPLLRGIGGSFSPDVFRSHVEALSANSKIVSIQEGFEKFAAGKITEPLVSFWFDDGFKGVRRYALPILRDQGASAAMSVNSKFTLRQEMFWRCKLSCINHLGGSGMLRELLQSSAMRQDNNATAHSQPDAITSVKSHVLDVFSLDIVSAIDQVYRELTTSRFRDDAFRIFDEIEGIRILFRNGWEICNHSCSHYPVGENSYIHRFQHDFDVCENDITDALGISTRFWVVPFDRVAHRSEKIHSTFEKADDRNRFLVLVGNKLNLEAGKQYRVLYRVSVPNLPGKALVRHLATLPVNAD